MFSPTRQIHQLATVNEVPFSSPTQLLLSLLFLTTLKSPHIIHERLNWQVVKHIHINQHSLHSFNQPFSFNNYKSIITIITINLKKIFCLILLPALLTSQLLLKICIQNCPQILLINSTDAISALVSWRNHTFALDIQITLLTDSVFVFEPKPLIV